MTIHTINENKKLKNIICIVYILLINALLVFFIEGGYIGLESNDDAFLSIIPSGWLGSYYPYTIHNNIVVGYSLAFLSKLLPSYNCTSIFYLILIMLSYYIAGIILIKKKGVVTGTLLLFILVTTTWLSFINRMNYSKSGAWVMVAGMLTISCNTERNNIKNRIIDLIGIALLITGSLIRYKTDLAVFPYFMLWGVYIAIKSKKESCRRIIPLLIAVFVIGITWMYDYHVYHSDAGWREFKEYNDIREQLMDYGIPDYSGNVEAYRDLGLNENDYKMLSTWQYADDDVFDTDTLKALLLYREDKYPRTVSMECIEKVISVVLTEIVSFKPILVTILVFTLVFLTTRDNKTWMVFILSLFMGQLVYLIYIGRYPERAVIIPVIATIIMLMYLYNPKYNRIGAISVIVSLIAIFSLFSCGLVHKDGWNKKEILIHDEVNDIYEKLSNEEQNLYVWHIYTASWNLEYSHDAFEGFAYGNHSNSVFSGGWLVPSPLMSDISEKFGEKNNVFKLLAMNPHVYYVAYKDDPIYEIGVEVVEQYIRDHYNVNAKARLIKEVGIYNIYSFCEND